jgi:hypothetical protein
MAYYPEIEILKKKIENPNWPKYQSSYVPMGQSVGSPTAATDNRPRWQKLLESYQDYFERPIAAELFMPWWELSHPEDPGSIRYREASTQPEGTMPSIQGWFMNPFKMYQQALPWNEVGQAYKEAEAPPYLRGSIEAAVGSLPLAWIPGARGIQQGLQKGGRAAQIGAKALTPAVKAEQGLEWLGKKGSEQVTKRLLKIFPDQLNIGVADDAASAARRLRPIRSALGQRKRPLIQRGNVTLRQTATMKDVTRSKALKAGEGAEYGTRMFHQGSMKFADTPTLASLQKPLTEGKIGIIPPSKVGQALQDVVTNSSKKWYQRAGDKIKGFYLQTLRGERIFQHMDGGEPGWWWRTFYQTIDNARTVVLRNIQSAEDLMRNVAKNNKINLPKMLSNRQSFVAADGRRFQLYSMEKIGLYLSSLNKQNLQYVKELNHFTDDMVRQVIDSMTPDEKFMAQMFRKYFNDRQRMQAVRQVREVVEGKTFREVDEYLPIWLKNREGAGTLDDWIVFEDDVAKGGVNYLKDIRSGMTKTRTGGGTGELELDAMAIFLRHVKNTENYIHMTPVARDLGIILRDDAVRNALKRAKLPGGTFKTLPHEVDTWVRDAVATSIGATDEQIGRLMRGLRVNAVTAVLGFNVVTAMKQFPSFVGAAALAGEKNVIRGLLRYTTHKHEYDELIKRYSPQIYRRAMEREIAEEAASRGGVQAMIRGRLTRKQVATYLTTTVDRNVVGSIWAGVFDDAMKKGATADDAARLAEQVIRKTQPFYDPKDLPALWRATGKGGELKKMFTVFQNQLNQYWNTMIFDVVGQKQLGNIGAAEAARRTMDTLVVPGLFIGAIANSKLPSDPAEAAQWVAEMGGAMVPVFGTQVLSAFRGYNPGVITLEPLERTYYAIQAGQKAVQEPANTNLAKAGQRAAEAAGYLGGYPVSQPKRTAQAILDLAQGKTDDLLELIWGSYIREQARSPSAKPSKGRTYRTPGGGSSGRPKKQQR